MLAPQHYTLITHAIIPAHSINLLQKVLSGMACPYWQGTIQSSAAKLLWVYCPGHAAVKGNEQADRLVSEADSGGQQLDKAEVLRGSRDFLNMADHSIIALITWRKEEWRKERPPFHPTSGMICVLFNQTKTGSVPGQPCGGCSETRQSPHGPFWTLRCHRGQRL